MRMECIYIYIYFFFWLKHNGHVSPEDHTIHLCSKASIRSLRPTQPSMQWVQRAPYPRGDRLGCEADRSPPFIVQIKNKLDLTTASYFKARRRANFALSLPHYCINIWLSLFFATQIGVQIMMQILFREIICSTD